MITTQNLTKLFDRYEAVSNLSLEIQPGCIYGLVGTNGAGKSTLLRTLAGIYRPSAGEALLDGSPIFDSVSAKSRIVLVPDDLWFFAGARLGRDGRLLPRQLPQLERGEVPPAAGSVSAAAGQKALRFFQGDAAAGCADPGPEPDPDYLLLDEAFDGLDPVIRLATRKLIADEVSGRGMTALISSHNLRELEDLCDHVAILHKGQLLMTREMDNLRTSYCKVQTAFRPAVRNTGSARTLGAAYRTGGQRLDPAGTGQQEEVFAALQPLNPVILDCISLTLEEVFISEMEAVGYDYNHIIF